MESLFEVDGYLLNAKIIFVDCHYPDKIEPIRREIFRKEFEDWLDGVGGLHWCVDEQDYKNEHDQRSGDITTWEYWDNQEKEIIYKDLHDFIMFKGTKTIFDDIEKLFSKITNP